MSEVSRRKLLMTGAAAVPAVALGSLLSACAPVPPPDVETALDVTDFGAVGDGTTDDTAAFAAAFAALGGEGGQVFVPPGVYVVVDIRPPAGCTLFGTGHPSVLKLAGGANRNLCTVTAPDVTVTRLRLDANRAAQTAVCNAIAFWAPAVRGRVEACEVVGAKGYNIVAFPGVTDILVAGNLSADADEELIECQGASRMVILDNHCLNAGKNAIYVWGNSAMNAAASEVTIAGNVVTGWSQAAPGYAGIRVGDASSDVTVTGNVVLSQGSGTDAVGLNASSSTAAPLDGVTVIANVVSAPPGMALASQNADGTTIHGNVAHDAGGYGVRVDRNAASTVVSANVIERCGSSGIGMLSAHDFTVRANLVRANGRDTSRPSFDRAGIALWGGVGENPPVQQGAVVANRCTDAAGSTQLNGIILINRIRSVTLAANVIDGNVAAGSATYSADLDPATATAPHRQRQAVSVGTAETAVAHGLGYAPTSVHVTQTSPTRIWVSRDADDVNLYLQAAAAGATCDVLFG